MSSIDKIISLVSSAKGGDPKSRRLLMDYIMKKEFGGPVGEVIEYNEGGSHDENPNGGVPIGEGENGKMNTVEEGEASYESDEGKYIFSNKIFLDGSINKK